MAEPSAPNPYAPPSDEAASGNKSNKRRRGRYTARLAGESLVVSLDAALPAVCMKCGVRDEIVRRKVDFQWTPVWARFLVFCAIGVIIMLVTRKRASLEVPLCVGCDKRWGAARTVAIVGAVALVAAFVLMRTSDEQRAIGLGLLLAAVVAFVATSIVYVRPRVLQAKSIDAAEITLKGVAPAAAQAIVDGSR